MTVALFIAAYLAAFGLLAIADWLWSDKPPPLDAERRERTK